MSCNWKVCGNCRTTADCLALGQASSCTSPRAGPALEWSGCFLQQQEGLPKGTAAPLCTGTQGSCWHPQPQALGAPAGQGGSSLPRCCPCSWVTFTTSICVIFSMHTAPLCQDSCCRMHGSHFFSLLEVFTFPSGGKTDATPELLAESLVLPAAPGIPKKWGSQDLFPEKLGSVIKQCIP